MTVVDDIKSRLDIMEVVSQHVALNRSGRSYKANCPFHQEKTPSFHVFPDRQSWRCFGACATGGDLFSFVMRAENMDFPEALKRLAQQAGVAVPGRERRSEQQATFKINDLACAYYQEQLFSSRGAYARQYLEERGLAREVIESFELGLSPQDGESLKNHLSSQGYSTQVLAQAGVVHVTQNGWARDLFRGRLMIPIRNSQGELGGFGARALEEGTTPKYLNSPRTPVFDKSRLLYALHRAKDAANQNGLVIVEGYMDVIAAHQHGFTNVVASMGTALTEHQVVAIRRLTSNVTMALDPDAAGQQATLRSLESSWNALHSTVLGHSGGVTTYHSRDLLEPKIAVLPTGQDPDALIRKSPDVWVTLLENPTPIFDFMLKAKLEEVDLSSPRGKADIAQYMSPLIWRAEPTQQDQYFQKLAGHLGVTRETLLATIGRPSSRPRARNRSTQSRGATPSPFAKLDNDPLEDYCLALLLQNDELGDSAGDLRSEYFRRLENREIFNQLTRRWTLQHEDGERGPSLTDLETEIDGELAEHLAVLANKALPPLEERHRRGAFQDTVRRLEERYLRELKAEEEIRFAETPPDLQEESHPTILQVNQRLRSTQSKRSSLAQDFSNRG